MKSLWERPWHLRWREKAKASRFYSWSQLTIRTKLYLLFSNQINWIILEFDIMMMMIIIIIAAKTYKNLFCQYSHDARHTNKCIFPFMADAVEFSLFIHAKLLSECFPCAGMCNTSTLARHRDFIESIVYYTTNCIVRTLTRTRLNRKLAYATENTFQYWITLSYGVESVPYGVCARMNTFICCLFLTSQRNARCGKECAWQRKKLLLFKWNK